MAEFMASRSRRVRKRVRGKSRRLSECCGPIDFHLAETPTEALEALSELMRLHQARWVGKGHPGAFADPAVLRFHQALVPAALADGHVRLNTLRDSSRTVAVAYDFRIGRNDQAYLTSFDPEYADLSPGLLLRHCAIEQAIADGAGRFDYLEGDEPHKAEWCDFRRENVRVWVFNRTPAGALARTQLVARNAAVDTARKWVPAETRADILKRIANTKTRATSGSDE
jgi:CelD/BcsL family acetyltransferase involved in cellulose biosynthesis